MSRHPISIVCVSFSLMAISFSVGISSAEEGWVSPWKNFEAKGNYSSGEKAGIKLKFVEIAAFATAFCGNKFETLKNDSSEYIVSYVKRNVSADSFRFYRRYILAQHSSDTYYNKTMVKAQDFVKSFKGCHNLLRYYQPTLLPSVDPLGMDSGVKNYE